MKKLLCYVAIVILLVIIILPPVFRAFVPENFDESELPPKQEIVLLNCKRSDETINLPYLDGKLNKIKYTFNTPILVDDENEPIDDDNNSNENETNDNEINEPMTLKKVLENIPNTVIRNDTDGTTTYSLDMNEIGVVDLVPAEYRDTSSNMKSYYTNLGYSCNFIE